MSFKLLTALLAKQLDQASTKTTSFFAKEKPRQDQHSLRAEPFCHLQLGKMVDISKAQADFLLLEVSGGLFSLSKSMFHCVGYGHSDSSAQTIHRFYLQSGSETAVLQVIGSDQNPLTPSDVKLFTLLTDYTPLTPEDWDTWLKYTPGDAPLLGGLYLTWEDSTFVRHWGTSSLDSAPEYVQPLHWNETLLFDPQEKGLSQIRETMLYSRSLDENNEFLQLSFVSAPATDEKWIEATVGVNISPDNIKII